MTSLRQEKQALRTVLLRRRSVMAERVVAASEGLVRQFPGPIALPEKSVVSGFLPIDSEIDTMPLLRKLSAAGHTIALPVVIERGAALVFRRWSEGDALESGPLGTRHPAARAPVVVPDVLLVPLLAFDRRGYRLGYGGGFYDRTLSALRRTRAVLAVGVGYSEQEVPAVPHGPQDERLDWIVTDRAIMHPETET